MSHHKVVYCSGARLAPGGNQKSFPCLNVNSDGGTELLLLFQGAMQNFIQNGGLNAI
jgi:hypothetical protein